MVISTRSLVMAQDLPFEIWHHISQFLTEEQLRRMYSLNRAFFYISMKLRYRKLYIGNFHGVGSRKTYRTYLRLLSNPKSSQYTRFLHLQFFLDPTLGGKQTVQQFFTHPSRDVVSQWKHLRNRLTMATKLTAFAGTLTHLTHLTVECHADDPLPVVPHHTLALLATGWKAYSHTLRSLTLRCPMTIWESFFPTSSNLNNLETLIFDVHHYPVSDEMRIIQSVLVPFIRKHSRTLRGLGFISYQAINFSTIYHGIGHLPHLKHLTIKELASESHHHITALEGFIQKHLDTLIEIHWESLDPTRKSSINCRGPFDLVVPHLRKITLGFSGPQPIDKFFRGVCRYVGEHRNTLTEITLSGRGLIPRQFSLFVKMVASPILKMLDIPVFILTSTAFSLLATQFPNLESLCLVYNIAGRQYSSLMVDGEQPSAALEEWNSPCFVRTSELFCLDMKELVYLVDWPVTMVQIKLSRWWEGSIECVGKAILTSMPRVDFMNGMYREDFLKLKDRED